MKNRALKIFVSLSMVLGPTLLCAIPWAVGYIAHDWRWVAILATMMLWLSLWREVRRIAREGTHGQ